MIITKFLHPDNQHLCPVDWRVPEKRKDMFFRWFNWRLEGKNIDHYTWNLAYMNTHKSVTGKPMSRRQKLWYSYLFGMTYQSSMAWIFYQMFPDFDNIDFKKLDSWNRETMPRQRFATDTRYNKGHIVAMVRSFKDWVDRIGGGDIEKAFDNCLCDTEEKSFSKLYEEISSLFKFGRMTSWLFSQCLYECAKLPIKPGTMFTDDPSNVSVWNGMCYYRGREDMTVGKPPKFAGYKPTKEDRENFKAYEKEMMAEAQQRIADKEFLSYFTLETHLCQFKKLNVGHDYPGQNVGDAVMRFAEFKSLWPEINFGAIEDSVNSDNMFENIRWLEESKSLMWLFYHTGQPINMDNLYKELPDMWKELGLSRNILKTKDNDPIIRGALEDYLAAQKGDWLSESLLFNRYEEMKNEC